MKNFSNIVEKIDNDNLIFFMGKDICMESAVWRSVIIFISDTSDAGRMENFTELAAALVAKQYSVTVVFLYDEQCKEALINAGCSVIIYPALMQDEEWLDKASDTFDLFLFDENFNRKAVTKVSLKVREMCIKVLAKDIFVEKILQSLKTAFQINEKPNDCSGCSACAAICPVSAITMKEDAKAFLYPHIDEKVCINCGKCEKVCPVHACHDHTKISAVKIAAVKIKDEQKRAQSQSGGAFTAIAEQILKEGGVVYGVGLNAALEAVYMRIENEKELAKLKGSKYVQAAVGTIFQTVQKDLSAGRKVLFSGTACHIDGLKHFLQNEDTSRLITCDLICHGVPSPKVYRDYKKFLERRQDKLVSFHFRDKNAGGWHQSIESFSFASGKSGISKNYTDLFYSNLCLRESCYTCKYANMNRISDITAGDFWGIEKVYPQLDDNKGMSLVMIHTGKGQAVFDAVCERTDIFPLTENQCIQPNLAEPTHRPAFTDTFWWEYSQRNLKYILRRYSNKYLATAASYVVLENWQNKLQQGQSIETYFIEMGAENIAVCGDMKDNQLVINALSKSSVCVKYVIDIFEKIGQESAAGIPVLTKETYAAAAEKETDAVLITDELNFSDILMQMYADGVSLNKIIPLSFISVAEV